jgi:hypothetical protein
MPNLTDILGVPCNQYYSHEYLEQAIATAQAEALREAAENEQKEKAIAFVKGAKWWEYHSTKGTMWQSDQELAAIEAEKRFGYKPTLDDLFPKETMARIISILADKQEGQ